MFNSLISEGLSFHAVLAQFVREAIVPSGRAPLVCAAYLCPSNVMDLLMVVARAGTVTPSVLQCAIVAMVD